MNTKNEFQLGQLHQSKQFSKKTTLFRYIKIQILRLKSVGRDRTAESYQQALNSLAKFRLGEDLLFEQITPDLIQTYEHYMRNLGLCRNTTSFYLRVFRSIYHRALQEGICAEQYPFKGVYTGVDKTNKRALTLSQIKSIKNLSINYLSKLDFARDLFLFSFYTRGMSFIDIAFLKKKNLVGDFLVYNRKKTGKQLSVKWEAPMQAIVRKWQQTNNQYLFPILVKENQPERRQYLNQMLLTNRRLKIIGTQAQIPFPLTMYVARHSWANIAQESNVPIQTISLGMGHENEKTTRIYLASIQTNVIDQANTQILKLLED